MILITHFTRSSINLKKDREPLGNFLQQVLFARIDEQTSFRREIHSRTDRTNLSNCDFFHVLYLAIHFSYMCSNWFALYSFFKAQVSFSYLQTLEFCSCILTVILSIQFYNLWVNWSTFVMRGNFKVVFVVIARQRKK